MATTVNKQLKVAEAADVLGVSVSWLNKARVTGIGGPPFHKIGARVLYDPAALVDWLASKRRRHTSH